MLIGPPGPSVPASAHLAAMGRMLADYNASQSEAEATLVTGIARGGPPVAVVPLAWGTSSPSTITGHPVELGPLLRQVNFDPGALLADLWRAGQWGGRQFAVPYTYSPQSVWVDPSAWSALAVPLPASDWTDEQFTATCAELHQARGRTRSVLGGFPWFPYPEVWPGWVLGYGGQLTTPQGDLVLTDDGARLGIAALIAAIRAAAPNMCAPADAALLGFADGGRGVLVPSTGARTRALARFPVLPAAPVVPTLVWTLGVNDDYPHPELAAAFLAWLLGPNGQAHMVGAGYPPMLEKSPAGSDAWVKTFPTGFDLGGLNPSPSDLRTIPTSVAATTAITVVAVWKCLDAPSDRERAALLADAEQQANAFLALPQDRQATFLKPFQVNVTLTGGPGSGSCLPVSLHIHSHYATAEPIPTAASPGNAGASAKAAE